MDGCYESTRTGRRWLTAVTLMVGAAVFVVIVGLTVFFLASGGGGGSATVSAPDEEDQAEFPEYVLNGPVDVVLAYQFARERPDVMLWMPCYCGCGGHIGHRNARDCFIRSASSSGDIQFDEHGSNCDVCVNIALRARELTTSGWTLTQIRTAIDQEFGDIGPATDTPLPPE
jgi:hypothetical protein